MYRETIYGHHTAQHMEPNANGDGRVVQRCWINSQGRGVLLKVAIAVGAGGGCLDIFLSFILSLFFLPLLETARYRLKYWLKGPLNPKQPTNLMHTLRTVPILPYLVFCLCQEKYGGNIFSLFTENF